MRHPADDGSQLRRRTGQDCDGAIDCADPDCQFDNDLDGFPAAPCGTDCDDNDPNVHPNAVEICRDGLDNDCNGAADCNDPVCAGDPSCCGNGACDAFENACTCPADCGSPPATEAGQCGDGADNDCDGCTDGADSDCGGQETSCTDGNDNDCDGSIDCADPDCVGDPSCCPPSQAPLAVLPPSHAVPGNNRYLSFVPQNSGRQTAIRVTLIGSSDFPAVVGKSWWVGPPTTYCENSGQSVPPAGGCGPAPGLPASTLLSADLQCSMHCMDWDGLGAEIHVGDREIVPGATYRVEAIDCACDPTVPGHFSPALTIGTPQWGDITGTCATCPCTVPDASVDVTTDVTALLSKFKNVACAVVTARADLEPDVPDRLVNISDVTRGLDAFRGRSYPLSAPSPCP